jgi:hypothetical protein
MSSQQSELASQLSNMSLQNRSSHAESSTIPESDNNLPGANMPPLTSSRVDKIKFEAVPEYHGVQAKCDEFILQLEIYFQAHGVGFQGASARVMYAVSRLRGTALSWVAPYIRDGSDPMLQDWTLFKKNFVNYFGDPLKARKAATKLMHVQQGKHTTIEHVAYFKRLMFDAG